MRSELMKLIKSGRFPNEKNRVWTMCQAALQMCLQCVKEAEENNLTDEQFYIAFLDCLNALTIDDKTSYINGLNTFKDDSI